MKIMGITLENKPSWGGSSLWEGSRGDWKFQIRKTPISEKTFLQVKITQVYTWSNPGPSIHADTTTPETVLWRHTFPVSKEDPDELLQGILDEWFEKELRTLEEKRRQRESAISRFLYNSSESFIL